METNVISKPANNTPYIYAVVLMVIFGVALVLGILFLRPMADLVIVIGAVFTAIAPTSAAILAFLKSQETHLSVNSRMDAWIASTQEEAHRKGVDETIAAAGLVPAPAVQPARLSVEVAKVPTKIKSPDAV